MQDYVALITGGAQGIGKATAHLLLFKGCRVVILDHDDEALALFDTENEARSDRFLTVRCNVTSPSEIQQAFEATVHTFGRLDFVVNNAGVTMCEAACQFVFGGVELYACHQFDQCVFDG